MWSRRQLVQRGLAGGALLGLAGVGVALQPGASLAPEVQLHVLTAAQFNTLVALEDVVIPPSNLAPTARQVHTTENIDALLHSLDPLVGQEVGQVLGLLENPLTGLLLDGLPRPFSALTLAQRTRVFEGWRTSRFILRRTAYKALRGLVASAYFADPRTHVRMAYPGPPPGLAPQRETP